MKRNWLKVVIPVCLILTLVAIPIIGCAEPEVTEPTYEWKIGQPYPEGTINYDLTEDYIRRVSEASDGRITHTHYPGALLGDYMVQNENVTLGTQECAISWPTDADSTKWGINAGLSFVVYNYDQAREAYGPGGWLFQVYGELCEECGWKLLGSFPTGFSGVASNVQFDPIPGPKNLKIRIPAFEPMRLNTEAEGFEPVTIPFSEIHSALQLGTVDAASGLAGSDDFMMFSDAYEYAYLYNMTFSVILNFINLELFNSLSAADQEMLERVGSEWSAYAWSAWLDHEEEAWDEIRDKVEAMES
jgi:TRAP-type C4-dicarboxylate transport system substrate-binding protein